MDEEGTRRGWGDERGGIEREKELNNKKHLEKEERKNEMYYLL
jgi:hypothetical protein